MGQKDKRDFLSLMFLESDAYSNMSMIESALQEGRDLSNYPVQPLYMAFKQLTKENAGALLPKLSDEQRQAFLDIDLWDKDELDVNNFTFWLNAYDRCSDDDVRAKFSQSESFALYLKGKFNIWTFDTEDPQYPDHDNYFLTDDNLLLFEFEESYEYVQEVKDLIGQLYYEMGVEAAYAHLFKMVSDGQMSMMEEEYRFKKERQRDLGFVDYYDALEVDNCFPNISVMDNFLKKKSPSTGEIPPELANQKLNKQALVPYKDRVDNFSEELSKITDAKRQRYLEFNFIRLVNASITLNGSIKEGSVAMNRAGLKTRSLMELGMSYLKDHCLPNGILNLAEGQELLDVLDFAEIYKIGNTLVRDIQKVIKKAIVGISLSQDSEGFLGAYWQEFVDHAFFFPPKIEDHGDGKLLEVNSYKLFTQFKERSETFSGLSPFIKTLYVAFAQLKSDGRLQDSYYLNYNVDQIDFESIMISSFANSVLGTETNGNGQKLGLTLEEFKDFTGKVLDGNGELLGQELTPFFDDFMKKYGLTEVPGFNAHMEYLLKKHIEGYDYQQLSYDDFRHVGGPIILDTH